MLKKNTLTRDYRKIYVKHEEQLIDLIDKGYQLIKIASTKPSQLKGLKSIGAVIAKIDRKDWVRLMMFDIDVPKEVDIKDYKQYYLENYSTDELLVLKHFNYEDKLKDIDIISYFKV